MFLRSEISGHQSLHNLGSNDTDAGLQAVADDKNDEEVPEVEASDLRNLQLTIGRERVRFLPNVSELVFDEVTEKDNYLPIAVLVGTYIASDPHLDLFGLEIWAYHTIKGPAVFPDLKPHAPLELVAFKDDGEHVPDIKGIEPNSTWGALMKHVDFLLEFSHLRSLAEFLCLVRYCFLLAANAQLFSFDGSTIPKDVSFARKLVDICKRRWDERRFKTYDETGVLPEDHEIWKDVQKGRSVQRQAAEMFSESEESSGEDEIPAVRSLGYRKHLKRKRRAQL
ncbi:Nn.00g040470.m01.CDS01 [Neocucurbitaria sp. VM-36]